MANIYDQSKTYLIDLENQKNTLGKKKYGNAYNPTLDWTKQTGAIMPSWTQMDEEYAKLALQNYDAQKNYANALQAQAQGLYNTANSSKAQLGVGNEIIQKYIGNNLRASGQNTSGLAETTQAQMGNNYLNNLAQINSTTRQNEIDLLSAYNSAKQAKENEYNTQVANLQQSNDNALGNEFQAYLNSLQQGGTLNQNTYNNVRQQYQNLSPSALAQFDKTYQGYIDRNAELAKYDADPNSQAISINTIKNDTFGSFNGSDYKDSEQNQYVSEIINRIQSNPNAYNGKIVDFNFGGGSSKYVIYNGMLYKVSSKTETDQEFKDIEKSIKGKRQPASFVAPML